MNENGSMNGVLSTGTRIHMAGDRGKGRYGVVESSHRVCATTFRQRFFRFRSVAVADLLNRVGSCVGLPKPKPEPRKTTAVNVKGPVCGHCSTRLIKCGRKGDFCSGCRAHV